MSDGERPRPLLSGVVVHWHGEDDLAELIAAWPDDERFELVVVDNGSSRPLGLPPSIRLVSPGRNLGFAGGANAGVAASRGAAVLLLNPDVRPEPGALDEILRGLDASPNAAGLAPRLAGPGGEPQFRWQLRPLPTPRDALLQALLLPVPRGPRIEPEPGAAIEQPAAAALVLRREALAAVGGLDAGFQPAWFEDVDLARRLSQAGRVLRYWPAARFRHRLGGSVPRLGYGPFLWIYFRNLDRYLAKHHGRGWAQAVRAALVPGLLLRLILLPLRCPRRAASRGEAARGLAGALLGALSGWRRPARFAGAYPAGTAAPELPSSPSAAPMASGTGADAHGLKPPQEEASGPGSPPQGLEERSPRLGGERILHHGSNPARPRS